MVTKVKACLLIVTFYLPLFAQEVDLTKNFLFRDGIYFTHGSFRANAPDLSWEEVQAQMFTNPQNLLTQVAYIKKGPDTLDLEQVWGFTINGAPSVRIQKEAIDKKMAAFAGLYLLGKICYFYYEREVEREVKISAYNPLTRKPFRSAPVKRKMIELSEKILHFESGDIKDFNLSNFKKWVKDDEDLMQRLESISIPVAKDELYDLLQIYNDRNVVFVRE